MVRKTLALIFIIKMVDEIYINYLFFGVQERLKGRSTLSVVRVVALEAPKFTVKSIKILKLLIMFN